jgi:hypothetical protein
MMEKDELTFSQLSVLAVLKREGYQTVNELNANTSSAHAEIRKDLAELIKRGLVFNLYKVHAFSIYLHKDYVLMMVEKAKQAATFDVEEVEEKEIEVELEKSPIKEEFQNKRLTRNGRPLAKEELALPLSVPFMTMNQRVGWNRVIVLKRIRDRLMEEYHPVLNAVIADYESMLKPIGEEHV